MKECIQALITGLSNGDVKEKKPPIPEDLCKFARNHEEMNQFFSESQKFQNKLETIIDEIDIDDVTKGDAKEKLVKYRKSLEMHQISKTNVLQGAIKLLKDIDVKHMKMVLELKKVFTIINKIDKCKSDINWNLHN